MLHLKPLAESTRNRIKHKTAMELQSCCKLAAIFEAKLQGCPRRTSHSEAAGVHIMSDGLRT
jgi:hypothetical protein